MTHLILRQSTTSTEQVDNTCIDDLCFLTTSLALDNSSDLVGRINTAVTTQAKIETLHTLDNSNPPVPVTTGNATRWDNLFATASTYSFQFEDAEVQRVMETNVFPNGVTTSAIRGLNNFKTTSNNNIFYNNTRIVLFNEFQYFTGLISVPDQAFEGCNKLEEIRLPNTIQSMGWLSFGRCKKLRKIYIPDSVKSIGDECFVELYGIEGYLVIPNITSLGNKAYNVDYNTTRKMKGIILLCNSVPTMGTTPFQAPNPSRGYPVYVKYSLYNTFRNQTRDPKLVEDTVLPQLKPFKLFRYGGSDWDEVTNISVDQVYEALNNISTDWQQQNIPVDGSLPSNPTTGQLAIMAYSSAS